MNKNGLTTIRTGRLVAAFNGVLGMLFLLLNRVLSAVVDMAGNAVNMGLARYSNFTGRFAADNFEEDKQLLALLKEANELLPLADTALSILMVLSVVFIAIALLGLLMPRNFVHILVALRLLKWVPKGGESYKGSKKSLSPLQKKIVLGTVGGLVLLIIVCAGISSCVEKVETATKQNYVKNMQEQALVYINAQKEFYGRNQKVGGPKGLQLPDSLETEGFSFKVTGSRFIAVSKVQIDSCAAGAKWQVSSAVKGFFTTELQLYRQPPKDPHCAALTPDFKNLGRVKAQTQP
ncbi:MAG: hypothetical protein MJY85_10110 [Fibrobacter sp.]|nr:hypothetical protein [Fibrobacter sp.]